MAKIFVLSLLVAASHAAPHVLTAGVAPVLGHAVATAPVHVGNAVVGHRTYTTGHTSVGAPQVVGTSVAEHVVAGPTHAQTVHEVVGHRTVQVGTQGVQTGHQYTQHPEITQAAPYTYIAEPAKNSQSTVQLPAPVIPNAPLTYAVPPAPTNQGPAPADTVTVTKIQAPVRTHTHITPQVTRVVPELAVNKYTVEIPKPVPVPVEREVIVEKHVAKPYPVEVPQPYAVPQPYKVHPVHQVVETPVIDQHHVTVHQPVAVATHTVAAAPVVGAYAHGAVAAPVAPVAGAYTHEAIAAPIAGAYAHGAIAAPALAHAGWPVVAAAKAE
jgi:hypothetical protein